MSFSRKPGKRPSRIGISGGYELARLIVGHCTDCDKNWYRSRKDARKAADAKHPGEKLQAYPCPARTSLWHFGHKRPVWERGKKKR